MATCFPWLTSLTNGDLERTVQVHVTGQRDEEGTEMEHRLVGSMCGAAGLDPESGEGPCRECSWDRNDGLAVTYERLDRVRLG
jgi:hypothetical protein